jgi:hypothetical protein
MPNSIKLCSTYPWVKRSQVCSNKGTDPLERGGGGGKNKKM